MELRETVAEFSRKREEAERLLEAPGRVEQEQGAESRVTPLLRELGELAGQLGIRGGGVVIVGPKSGSDCVQYKMEGGRHCVLIAEGKDSSGRTISCTYRCEDEIPEKLPKVQVESL